MFQQALETVPGHTSPLRAAVKPLAPDPSDTVAQPFQGVVVATNPEVGVMALELLHKVSVLVGDWQVSVAATPVTDAVEGPGETASCRRLLHHPGSLAGASPVMIEAQEVEASGPKPMLPQRTPRRGPKVNQSGLGRVEL